MELALFIWAISSLDSITQMLIWIPISLLTAAGMWLAFVNDMSTYNDESREKRDKNKVIAFKHAKRSLIAVLICLPIAVVLPSTKTAWMMTGGYVAQNVVTSETAKKLTKLVEAKLDSMIEGAMPKVKKENQ
jgi:hypothetical protein